MHFLKSSRLSPANNYLTWNFILLTCELDKINLDVMGMVNGILKYFLVWIYFKLSREVGQDLVYVRLLLKLAEKQF